jgi:phospholipid/cholesterol/gamma-HCH transport system permease protein
MRTTAPALGHYELDREGDILRVRLSGPWTLAAGLPSTQAVIEALAEPPPIHRLVFLADALEGWDSVLVAFLNASTEAASARGVAVDAGDLPEGARKLVELARAVPPATDARPREDDALLARVGRVALGIWKTASDALLFLGETALAAGALLVGRVRFRRVDLMHAFEATGVGALGIVALINFLIGAVLAFVGAVQLEQFGAGIYVANLVAIGVTRELGPLMTGIVMAGRTGASFAAVLGTMTVNEEVDALRTMAVKPAEFLVLPRVLATGLMLPALVAYADLLGLLGGLFVGVAVLNLGATEYARQTTEVLALRHVWIGLAKSVAFGVVVATTGCFYGIRSGRSAAAVGAATTRAVVMGITLVVVVDAIATVVLHALRL